MSGRPRAPCSSRWIRASSAAASSPSRIGTAACAMIGPPSRLASTKGGHAADLDAVASAWPTSGKRGEQRRMGVDDPEWKRVEQRRSLANPASTIASTCWPARTSSSFASKPRDPRTRRDRPPLGAPGERRAIERGRVRPIRDHDGDRRGASAPRASRRAAPASWSRCPRRNADRITPAATPPRCRVRPACRRRARAPVRVTPRLRVARRPRSCPAAVNVRSISSSLTPRSRCSFSMIAGAGPMCHRARPSPSKIRGGFSISPPPVICARRPSTAGRAARETPRRR